MGALYNREGKGLSWFSAKSCIAEAIVTEGLIALTSDTVEGRMLRQQVARLNLERGTVNSPYRHPVRHNEEFGKMESGIMNSTSRIVILCSRLISSNSIRRLR